MVSGRKQCELVGRMLGISCPGTRFWKERLVVSFFFFQVQILIMVSSGGDTLQYEWYLRDFLSVYL